MEVAAEKWVPAFVQGRQGGLVPYRHSCRNPWVRAQRGPRTGSAEIRNPGAASRTAAGSPWMPAFAGMTERGEKQSHQYTPPVPLAGVPLAGAAPEGTTGAPAAAGPAATGLI